MLCWLNNKIYNFIYNIFCYIGRYTIGAILIAIISFIVLTFIYMFEFLFVILKGIVNLLMNMLNFIISKFKFYMHDCYDYKRYKKIWTNRYLNRNKKIKSDDEKIREIAKF